MGVAATILRASYHGPLNPKLVPMPMLVTFVPLCSSVKVKLAGTNRIKIVKRGCFTEALRANREG